MKRHISPLFAAIAALLIFTASPAMGQTSPDEVASEVGDRGYYIDEGIDVDPDRISDAVARAGNEGYRFFVVLLDEDPPGGATTFAGAVLDRLGSGTVLVLSVSREGMESTVLSQTEIARALDLGFDSGGGDEGYVEAVVSSLTSAATSSPTTSTSSGGGSSAGLFIMLGFIGLLVLAVWWGIRRQRKASAQSDERMVSEARKEIKSQLDSMANTILEISDRVSLSESKQDNQYLEQAGATYGTAMEEFEDALDLGALETMSDRLDEARWQLDAATALAGGKDVPPKPEREIRHQCFFDPNHPEATEVADLATSAGTRKVRVCRDDAAKLRSGRQPKPRMIRVAGRNVPAPMAPRSHGGGGLGWLNVFSVVLGGMAQERSYDWSRSQGGGRVSGTRNRSSSSPKSTSSPKSSGSSGSSRSRAGRSRRRRR